MNMYIGNKKIAAICMGIIIFSLSNVACKKTYNDLINGQTVDERLSAELSAYENLLVSAPYGWKLVENPDIAYNGGESDSISNVFSFYMTFNDSNSVTMYADFDTTTASVPRTSTWRIKALQRPTLIFDTRNYIHYPSDPNAAISKSPLGGGLGWGTDFEFAFADNQPVNQLGDTIHLKGIYNMTNAYMVKATQAEQTVFTSGQYGADMKGFYSINKILTYWKRMTISGVAYEVTAVDYVGKTITLSYKDAAGNLQTVSVGFYYAFDGSVQFNTPFTDGNITITGLNNFSYNGTSVTLSALGVNATGTIIPATTPLKTDTLAAQRWWNDAYSLGVYWSSVNGFHVNGVDDAYGIRSISYTSGSVIYPYYWLAYIPGFGGTGANAYDFFGPLFLVGNSLSYAYGTEPYRPSTTGTRSLFMPDGRLRFNQYSNAGTFPATGAAANSRTLLYNTNGFFFVQTSDRSYDMISASDAKSWISWSR